VYIFRQKKGDRKKLLDASLAFTCEPWIAVYAECDSRADLFLTSLKNYDEKYKRGEKAVDMIGRTTSVSETPVDHFLKA
jgi:hypothetical protein